jgi:hypothetical protein
MYTLITKELVITETSFTRWWVLRDQDQRGVYDIDMLEKYYDDLYHLFLSKLVKLNSASSVSLEEKKQLQNLLTEVLKTKSLLTKTK